MRSVWRTFCALYGVKPACQAAKLHCQCKQRSAEASGARAQGVMLSHANLRYQVDNMGRYIDLKAGDKSLSLLPPWHMYERACSYYMLRCACCQVSS